MNPPRPPLILAARSMLVRSSRNGPMICKPTGKPPDVRPAGATVAGSPSKLLAIQVGCGLRMAVCPAKSRGFAFPRDDYRVGMPRRCSLVSESQRCAGNRIGMPLVAASVAHVEDATSRSDTACAFVLFAASFALSVVCCLIAQIAARSQCLAGRVTGIQNLSRQRRSPTSIIEWVAGSERRPWMVGMCGVTVTALGAYSVLSRGMPMDATSIRY